MADVVVTNADREAVEQARAWCDDMDEPEMTQAFARRAAQARKQALEEAAKVVDDHAEAWGLAYKSMTDTLSQAIRAIGDKE